MSGSDDLLYWISKQDWHAVGTRSGQDQPALIGHHRVVAFRFSFPQNPDIAGVVHLKERGPEFRKLQQFLFNNI